MSISNSLARRTENFTGADLEDLVRRAGLTALRAGLDAKTVTMADFEAALKETRASVTPDMLEEYEKIQDTLKSDAVRPNSGIGFVLPGMLRPRSETAKKLAQSSRLRPHGISATSSSAETANGKWGSTA